MGGPKTKALTWSSAVLLMVAVHALLLRRGGARTEDPGLLHRVRTRPDNAPHQGISPPALQAKPHPHNH